jgi:hypothetical protein
MEGMMSRFIRKQHKVLKTIVVFYAVNMMDGFFRLKRLGDKKTFTRTMGLSFSPRNESSLANYTFFHKLSLP